MHTCVCVGSGKGAVLCYFSCNADIMVRHCCRLATQAHELVTHEHCMKRELEDCGLCSCRQC